MEKFWLLMAILSFAYSIYAFGREGLTTHTMTSLALSLVATAMFYSRRYLRKKFEKHQRDNEE